jgi:hypothetical protein
LPQPPAFPQPPAGGQQTQPPRPGFTPLNPNAARRPSLSQGRTVSGPGATPSPSLRSGGIEGEQLPGLRGRRNRRDEEEIYDDGPDGGFLDGLI